MLGEASGSYSSWLDKHWNMVANPFEGKMYW